MQPARLAESRIVKKLLPRQPGGKRLADRYGDALVCIRYRIDPVHQRRYTTVELVVAEAPLPADSMHREVALRIAYAETDLRQRVKAAGGRWDPAGKLWRLPRGEAKALGLLRRIVEAPAADV